MLFVTEQFLIFFIIVYIAFWVTPARYRIELLIVASLYFYATWSKPFAVLLVLVVFVNYYVMEYWRRVKWKWMFFLLQAVNVSNIAVFKYYYLLADVAGRIAGIESLTEPHLRETHRLAGEEILLPLAISFYTFQIMSYGIDIYRGTYDKRHTFREVLLFKVFFPQLIAGPIMRAHELLPQIQQCREDALWQPDPEKIKRGLWLIISGLIKKMIIAQQMTIFSAPLIGGDPLLYNGVGVWISVLAALFMLYADFSAYTDLARGFGLMMGFEIPLNFKAPLFFSSLSDFWTRWHITFSRWIRDYIFIPLGGSRVSEGRIFFNLTLTFFLGGLWHGASYNFVIWGTLMGIWLSIESTIERKGILKQNLGFRFFRGAAGYIVWLLTGAFFFSPDLEWSLKAVSQMVNFASFQEPDLLFPSRLESFFGSALAIGVFHWIDEKGEYLTRFRKYETWLLPVVSIVVIIALSQFAGAQQDFFYFQF